MSKPPSSTAAPSHRDIVADIVRRLKRIHGLAAIAGEAEGTEICHEVKQCLDQMLKLDDALE